MNDLQLHPSDILHLTDTDTATSSALALPPKVAKLFAADWRAGLITLAGTGGEYLSPDIRDEILEGRPLR